MNRRMSYLCCVATTMVVGSTPALAQLPGYRVLDLVLEQEQFNQLCLEHFDFDAGQRQAILPLFEEYLDAVKELDSSSYEDSQDAGLRALREQRRSRQRALAKRPWDYDDPEFQVPETTESEVKLRRKAFELENSARREGDQLLFQLLESIHLQLDDDELSPDDTVSLIRLHCYFNAHRGQAQPDFKFHPDLRELVLSSIASGGNFETIVIGEGQDRNAPEEELRRLCQAYEKSMSSAINQLMAHRRVAHAPDWIGRPIILSQDDLDSQRALQHAGQRWASLYDVNRAFSDRIFSLLWNAGLENEAQKWALQFQRAYAPVLMSSDACDTLVEWVSKELHATDEQIEAVKARATEYRRRRHRTRSDGFDDITVRMRKYGLPTGYPRNDPLRNATGERLRASQDQLIEDIRSLLSESQRDSLESFIETWRTNQYGVFVIVADGA